MVRPIREDFQGAWHHVMNRGRNRDLIFLDDDDALDFLDTIDDTVERFGIEVHAYSLLPNHYHLLVRTPLGNLSDAMRHLGAVWALQRSTFLTYREIGDQLDMTLQHVARDVRRNRGGIEKFSEWTETWLERYPSKVSIVLL